MILSLNHEMMTVQEAATLLGISKQRFYQIVGNSGSRIKKSTLYHSDIVHQELMQRKMAEFGTQMSAEVLHSLYGHKTLYETFEATGRLLASNFATDDVLNIHSDFVTEWLSEVFVILRDTNIQNSALYYQQSTDTLADALVKQLNAKYPENDFKYHTIEDGYRAYTLILDFSENIELKPMLDNLQIRERVIAMSLKLLEENLNLLNMQQIELIDRRTNVRQLQKRLLYILFDLDMSEVIS